MLTFEEFQLQHDDSYEYWRGQAVARSAATLTHGLTQAIAGMLLMDAGYVAALSVELWIEPEARPLPDVIATTGEIETTVSGAGRRCGGRDPV